MTTGADTSPTWTNYTPVVSERTSGTSKFNHSGIKNVDAQSASNQTVNATREYDAFGNVTSSTGSQTGRFGYGGPYGYQEDEGGLKQLGHRLYDPVAGRFVTKDPIKSGRNLYGYAENNPLVLSDPNGLTPEDKCNSVEAAAPDTSDFARRYRNEHEDTEVGGYIYQNPNGTWSYTYAVGEPTQVDPKKRRLPNAANIVEHGILIRTKKEINLAMINQALTWIHESHRQMTSTC
jgi:RHS repeat-associated protein